MNKLNWLNYNSGSIMAVLTFVYVIATILILVSNSRSTKIANEQLLEMKEQFYEEFRPILTIEPISWGNNEIIFRITNIGNRAAKNIYLEYLTQVFKINGNERIIEGQHKYEVLADDRLLQPQKSFEYTLDNYITENSKTIDVILFYESYKKEYKERTCVHSNG